MALESAPNGTYGIMKIASCVYSLKAEAGWNAYISQSRIYCRVRLSPLSTMPASPEMRPLLSIPEGSCRRVRTRDRKW